MGRMLRAGLLLMALASCARAPAHYESWDTHADGTAKTSEEMAQQYENQRAECRRLYNMLGDKSLSPQQIEAIRVSMNVNFCAGKVP